jgi:FtsZ-interacting cell division protein ZipA
MLKLSDLQLALIAAGAVVIVAVILYNMWQERRARRRAEEAFGPGPRDALFDAAPAERREPTLGAMPGADEGEPVLARAQSRKPRSRRASTPSR